MSAARTVALHSAWYSDSLYFDEETDLLNHVGYHNELGDWRAWGGVLHPHRWVFGRKGGHTTYIWQEVIDMPARH